MVPTGVTTDVTVSDREQLVCVTRSVHGPKQFAKDDDKWWCYLSDIHDQLSERGFKEQLKNVSRLSVVYR